MWSAESIGKNLDPIWKELILQFLISSPGEELSSKIEKDLSEGKTILPPASKTFSAFESTDFKQVKVVILGQDPYHGKGQANGLAFSVPEGFKIPPSLKNIYKEIESDLSITNTKGILDSWAKQGVLLLNTALTVIEGQANSHQKYGWIHLSNSIIEKLNTEAHGLIFILWGAHAQSFKPKINQDKHHILESSHPSPLSAYRGFLGSKVFSKTNHILISQKQTPISWIIT
ncbi:MAG: uracil-DNA glycosylase [Bdellovibrionales bacterium]